ncbi:MAG: winged helix-turn-helix domain-containing protein [Mycobacteriales bacterium]|nr:MAG: transcriptional regulator [Pseudonocardiales bacterium]
MDLLVMTGRDDPVAVLPALDLLPHTVRGVPPDVVVLLSSTAADAVIVDACNDLVAARSLTRLLDTTGVACPVIAVLTEGGLSALRADWRVDDVVLACAGPAEIEARLQLAVGRRAAVDGASSLTRLGDLVVDEETYTVRLRGRLLDLTYKEFELLKFLAQHAGRVFSRTQLLQEVWGYDYYGGNRTVDVHIRRLRAKLGAEHEALIGTVRGVGYKVVRAPAVSDVTATRAVEPIDAAASRLG